MDIGFLIDNEERAAGSGQTFERHNPVSGDVVTRAARASVEDAGAAVASAAKAFEIWSRKGPGEKRTLMMKAADIMDSKAEEFTRTMMAETGATGPWAGFNVMLAAGMIREAASLTTQIGGEIIPSNKPGTLAMAMAKPNGVCLGIAPWNAPVILGTRAVAMPIACGNTVVLKASEMCPATHRLIGQCFAEAGMPEGVLNVVTNAPEDAPQIVEALIAHPDVKHVNFTGSTSVGRIIGRLAGENLKPVLLELGGKAPLIVLDDADIDGAVNAAVFGSFMNQGQICMSTERIIVDEKIADEFVKKLAAAGEPAAGRRSARIMSCSVRWSARGRPRRWTGSDCRCEGQGRAVVAGGGRDGRPWSRRRCSTTSIRRCGSTSRRASARSSRSSA